MSIVFYRITLTNAATVRAPGRQREPRPSPGRSFHSETPRRRAFSFAAYHGISVFMGSRLLSYFVPRQIGETRDHSCAAQHGARCASQCQRRRVWVLQRDCDSAPAAQTAQHTTVAAAKARSYRAAIPTVSGTYTSAQGDCVERDEHPPLESATARRGAALEPAQTDASRSSTSRMSIQGSTRAPPETTLYARAPLEIGALLHLWSYSTCRRMNLSFNRSLAFKLFFLSESEFSSSWS